MKPSLPLFYAISKMHKIPIQFRYISSSENSSLKPLTVCLHHISKFFKKFFISYIHKSNSPNKYNSISSSEQLLNIIYNNNFCSSEHSLHSFTTADFSNLFINFSHSIIYDSLIFFSHLIFSYSHRHFLIYNKFSQSIYFSCSLYKKLHEDIILPESQLNYLFFKAIRENYITFAGLIFQQIKGIPMGGNCSLHIADLISSVLEYKNNLIPTDIAMFCYIGDLIIGDLLSKETLKSFYFNCPDIQITNDNPCSVDYLNLALSSFNNNIITSLYNKRNKYNFFIVNLANYKTNISLKIQMATLLTEIFKFINIHSEFKNFIPNLKKFCFLYIQAGFPVNLIIKKVSWLFF